METKKEDKNFEEELRRLFEIKHPELRHDITWLAKSVPQKLTKEWNEFCNERFKQSEFEQRQKIMDENDNLKNQLNEKQKELEESIDARKRLQAEFENFKKRIDKEKIEFIKFAHADVIASMLPVLDSFEIALKNTTDKEKFVEGIKIIYAQIYSVLEAEGLKPIKATGEKFDPYKHEVLMKQESDKPDDTVLEEFQKGYMLNDRVLRHSKVKVSGK